MRSRISIVLTIPDAAYGALDPGRGNLSIPLRFRTSEKLVNVIHTSHE